MAATSVNNDDQIKIDPVQTLLIDAQLFSLQNDENETDVTTDIDNPEKDMSTNKQTSLPFRPSSDFSIVPSSSSLTNRRQITRSYKFVQLERALKSAKLLKTNDDRLKFEDEYLIALNEDKFDQFLEHYYQKIYDHYKQIEHEQELKNSRVFTFVDLEKNFLALDPTRDVKIIFIDEPTSSTKAKLPHEKNFRPSTGASKKSSSSNISNDTAVEAFYANRSQHLLANPSRARHEITLFARRAAEHLQERLPRMSSVPHRVKIVDDRDTTSKPDERTLLQMQHKRALSVINKRRNLFIKMMTQTKKNQVKMEKQWKRSPIALDNAVCCHELLERANQIQQIHGEEQIRRPRTAFASQRISNKNKSCLNSPDIGRMVNNINSTTSTDSTPFKDALSLEHMEKTKNVRVLLPTRPLTAPVKVNWINYC